VIEYQFDMGFAAAIEAGSKRGTIRRLRIPPRRHAFPGERIGLWIDDGLYRKQIRQADCAGVDGIYLHLARDIVRVGPLARNRNTWPDLDAGGREGLARLTGHAGWKAAGEAYAARYGDLPFTGCLVTWRDPEYSGPIPSRPQLEALRILTEHDRVIPAFGKFHPRTGHSLLVLAWAEVTDRSQQFRIEDQRGQSPIRITDLGRWILERFGK
jgi:hypothetical protein